MSPHLVVVGGLTGGHVLPNVTLALAMQTRGWRVTYVGASGQLEEEIAARHRIDFCGFAYARRPALSRLFSQLSAFFWALRTLRRFRPRVVFSKGSSVSTPVVIAAYVLRIPVIVHESDSVAGSETRLVQRLASTFCIGYSEVARSISVSTIVTGNLTRPHCLDGDRETARQLFPVDFEKPVVFVTGGSQGAASLNALLWPILEELTERYSVIHQCGVGKMQPGLALRDYCAVELLNDELRHVYAASDLVVARAGATTIAEVSSWRIPAIYVPYPWAEHDHQSSNATIAEQNGGCVALKQSELTPGRLLEAIDTMMSRRDSYRLQYRDRQVDALSRIAGLIESYAPAGARRRTGAHSRDHLYQDKDRD